MNLENRWAMEDWLTSANYLFATAHNSVYTDLGAVGVLDHRFNAQEAPFEMEFVVLDAEPHAVVEAIKAYNPPTHEKFSVCVFHATPDAEWLLAQYATLGYEYESNNAIYGVELPAPLSVADLTVSEIMTGADVELVNTTHSDEQPISAHIVGAPHIHHFQAKINGLVVGWAQMVTVVPRTAYVCAMFTLPQFRQRGVAAALLNRIHTKALDMSFERVILIPSDMAQNYYQKHGYQPLIYFTAFQPSK